MSLLASGAMENDTLLIGKVPIVPESRQHRQSAILEITKKSTHLINIDEIARDLRVDPLDIVKSLRKSFDNFKVIFHGNKTRVIFQGYEPFVDRSIQDFIDIITADNDIDWNQ